MWIPCCTCPQHCQPQPDQAADHQTRRNYCNLPCTEFRNICCKTVELPSYSEEKHCCRRGWQGTLCYLPQKKKARARSQELPHCTGISLPFEKVGLDIFHKPDSPPSQLNSAIDDLGKVLGASELLARKHPSWQMDYLSPSCQTPCHLGAASTLSCHTGPLPLYLSAYLLSLPDSSSAHALC